MTQKKKKEKTPYPDVSNEVVSLGTACNLVDVSNGLEKEGSALKNPKKKKKKRGRVISS